MTNSVVAQSIGTPSVQILGQPKTGWILTAINALRAVWTAPWYLSGTGVPSNAVGNNGQYYFRLDGGVAVSKTHLYFKVSGAWVALV
jgi:hypothetical protein